MPTYEYYCASCNKKFDILQGIKEKPLVKCPHCKKAKPERLISSGAGLIFKGTGFYQTDYKKSNSSSKSSESSSKPGKSEPKK